MIVHKPKHQEVKQFPNDDIEVFTPLLDSLYRPVISRLQKHRGSGLTSDIAAAQDTAEEIIKETIT
jgi:hypothetical protein